MASQVAIARTTGTIYDGQVFCYDTVYANARSGAGTFTFDPLGLALEDELGGQRYNAPNYICYQWFTYFSSTSIKPGDSIVGAELKFYGSLDASDTDFTVNGYVIPSPGAISTSSWIDVGDFGDATHPLAFTFDTSGGWSTVGYNTFSNESDVLETLQNKITATGFSIAMCFVSSRFIGNNTPTGDERVRAYFPQSTESNKVPVLTLDYVSGGGGLLGHNF